MRSGNGRHRRPRQAPAIFVTAGVTGAGLAMPLIAASGAQAADATTWDRVAQCESGGMWSADTGNGYYGGLQFTQETWESHGGRDFAPTADRASRSQQIEIAEKVLAAEGPMAWPNCAVNSGLMEDSEGSGSEAGGTGTPLDEILTPSPEETGGADGTDGAAEPGGSGGSGESAESSGDGTADSGKNGDTDPAESGAAEPGGPPGSQSPEPSETGAGDSAEAAPEGAGKHRGEPAQEDDAARGDAKAREGGDSGRHASRDGQSDRSGDESPAPGERQNEYTVRSGDSLSLIAEEHAVEGGWPALYDSNESVVGEDPDLIVPGQRLDLTVGEG